MEAALGGREETIYFLLAQPGLEVDMQDNVSILDAWFRAHIMYYYTPVQFCCVFIYTAHVLESLLV